VKKVKLAKISITVCIVFLGVWLLAIVFSNNSDDCKTLTDIDARNMVENILTEKYQNSDNGIILFGFDYKLIDFSHTELSFGPTEVDNSIDVVFRDRTSNEKMFTAAIFPSCEIQWIKSSGAN
jgi:hypothetical protein